MEMNRKQVNRTRVKTDQGPLKTERGSNWVPKISRNNSYERGQWQHPKPVSYGFGRSEEGWEHPQLPKPSYKGVFDQRRGYDSGNRHRASAQVNSRKRMANEADSSYSSFQYLEQLEYLEDNELRHMKASKKQNKARKQRNRRNPQYFVQRNYSSYQSSEQPHFLPISIDEDQLGPFYIEEQSNRAENQKKRKNWRIDAYDPGMEYFNHRDTDVYKVSNYSLQSHQMSQKIVTRNENEVKQEQSRNHPNFHIAAENYDDDRHHRTHSNNNNNRTLRVNNSYKETQNFNDYEQSNTGNNSEDFHRNRARIRNRKKRMRQKMKKREAKLRSRTNILLFALDMPLEQKKALVREERRRNFEETFKKVIKENKAFKQRYEDVNFLHPEHFNEACKIACINWFDGTKDKRGKIVHVFGKRNLGEIQANHDSSSNIVYCPIDRE